MAHKFTFDPDQHPDQLLPNPEAGVIVWEHTHDRLAPHPHLRPDHTGQITLYSDAGAVVQGTGYLDDYTADQLQRAASYTIHRVTVDQHQQPDPR
jgi:hypothetical protein